MQTRIDENVSIARSLTPPVVHDEVVFNGRTMIVHCGYAACVCCTPYPYSLAAHGAGYKTVECLTSKGELNERTPNLPICLPSFTAAAPEINVKQAQMWLGNSV